MATVKCTFTHYGWMGFCPVIISEPESEGPTINARYWWLEWVHDLSIGMCNSINFVLSCMNPDYEPNYPLWISGELKKPITIEAERDLY